MRSDTRKSEGGLVRNFENVLLFVLQKKKNDLKKLKENEQQDLRDILVDRFENGQ